MSRREQQCHTKCRVPDQCWTANHHGYRTISLGDLKLGNQLLIQNCIRRRMHYWQSDNIQRINNLQNHISAKIYSRQVRYRFFSTTTDEDGYCPFDLFPIACTYIAWSDECFPKENVSLELTFMFYVLVLLFLFLCQLHLTSLFIGTFVSWFRCCCW